MITTPPAVWVPLLVVLLGVLGWVAKRVLWDPLDELRKAEAARHEREKGYVTQRELDMQVQQITEKIAAGFRQLREERDGGEARLIRHLDALTTANNAQRAEARQDIQNLTKRVDHVMQQASRPRDN